MPTVIIRIIIVSTALTPMIITTTRFTLLATITRFTPKPDDCCYQGWHASQKRSTNPRQNLSTLTWRRKARLIQPLTVRSLAARNTSEYTSVSTRRKLHDSRGAPWRRSRSRRSTHWLNLSALLNPSKVVKLMAGADLQRWRQRWPSMHVRTASCAGMSDSKCWRTPSGRSLMQSTSLSAGVSCSLLGRF